MSSLERRLTNLEDQVVRLHVDRQMVTVARSCAAEGIPEMWLPELRRRLEDHARWVAAHAPLTPEMAEEEAARLGVTPAEVIAEAERIVELYFDDFEASLAMSLKKRLDDLERAATHLDDDGGLAIAWVGEDGSVERVEPRQPDEPIDYRRCLPAAP